MRFVVYGAGAIGGVLGARLAQHGQDVALIARGAHLEAIRRSSLVLETPQERTSVDLLAVDHPSALSVTAADVVLLCMKVQDSAAALADLASCAPSSVPVICLQNGVEGERLALRRFPNVYGVAVMCPTALLEPGVVQAYSTPTTGMLDLGRYPSGVDGVAEVLAAAFTSATFPSEPRAAIMRWKYRKLMMNLGNAVEAVCGPAARGGEVGRRAAEEGEACLAAAGIDVVSVEEDAARRGDLLRLGPIGGRARPGGSSWQSLARGTGSIESDHLNGEVVLLGRLHGVATPVNARLQRLAGRMAHERLPPGTLTEEEVLAQ